MFGTIPSIPIALANFGMGLTSYSNSSLRIGAATLIPTQQNGGFHWDSDLKFSCLLLHNEKEKKLKKKVGSFMPAGVFFRNY